MTYPKERAFGRYHGPRGRRARRLVRAMNVGRNAREGDACPYSKRAYVAAWLHGIALRCGRNRSARVWRPRAEAEIRRDFRGGFDRALRKAVRRSLAAPFAHAFGKKQTPAVRDLARRIGL